MKKSKLSLAALILGVIALLIMASVFFSKGNTANEAEAVGRAIGKAIVMPAVIATFVAVVLNLIGYTMNHRIITLISAIFYTIALIIMPLWGFIDIPSMILQYVAFAKMKQPVE